MKIIGHQKILKYLSKAVVNNLVSHAYLFAGPKHVGKATVARWFGKILLCERTTEGVPCGACRACVEVEKGVYPDFHYIIPEDTKMINIDAVRGLKAALSKTPLRNSYKIVIIDPAEALGGEAANALLKTLEEPYGKTVFILIAHAPAGIAETIISRAELITFSQVSRTEIMQALPETYSNEQKEFVARVAMGKVGLALSMNKETIHERANDEREIARLLAAPSHEQLVSLPRLRERLGDKMAEYTATILRDILLYKIGRAERMVHRYLARELVCLGTRLKLPAVARALDALLAMERDMRHNVNEELLWSTLLLQLSSNDALYSSQSGYLQADARPLAFG